MFKAINLKQQQMASAHGRESRRLTLTQSSAFRGPHVAVQKSNASRRQCLECLLLICVMRVQTSYVSTFRIAGLLTSIAFISLAVHFRTADQEVGGSKGEAPKLARLAQHGPPSHAIW